MGRTWRVDALLALALLLLAGPLVQQFSGYPAIRYALTVSAVDDHSLRVDPYEPFIGIDRAAYKGHIYSHTAPYQPLAAAVPFQAWRWAGGEAFPVVDGAYPAHNGDLTDPDRVLRGLWWVTLWSSVLPAIGLVMVLRRMVARVAPAVAAPVAVAMVAGTVILPFATVLFGHVMAALLVAGAWALVRRGSPSVGAAAVAGLLLGAGIGTEYTVAVAALGILIVLVATRCWRAAVALSVGTVIGTIPLLVYNWLVFENPFETAYQGHLPYFEGAGAAGVYNLQAPRLEEIVRLLIGDRGLFTQTPVMIVAVAGCVWLLRDRRPGRADAWLALGTLVVMILVSTGIDGYGGASAGPRYLIPILPLFAIPLAEGWRRVPLAAAVTTIFGTITMVTATLTGPLRGPGPPLADWYDDLLHGRVAANVLTGTSGSWIPYLCAVGAVGATLLALRIARDETAPTVATAPVPNQSA